MSILFFKEMNDNKLMEVRDDLCLLLGCNKSSIQFRNIEYFNQNTPQTLDGFHSDNLMDQANAFAGLAYFGEGYSAFSIARNIVDDQKVKDAFASKYIGIMSDSTTQEQLLPLLTLFRDRYYVWQTEYLIGKIYDDNGKYGLNHYDESYVKEIASTVPEVSDLREAFVIGKKRMFEREVEDFRSLFSL